MTIDLLAYQNDYFGELHDAFIDAFSNYLISFRPSRAQFHQRIYSKLRIDPSLSGLAIMDDTIVSFILHTCNTYQKKKTLYNGGTGTRQNNQGEGHAFKLYEHLFPVLMASGAERILLEVVDTNVPGQKLYEHLGFHFRRVFKCYKQAHQVQARMQPEVSISESTWTADLDRHLSFEPCFMDSSNQLQLNLKNETVLVARKKGSTVGHLIFQPHLGRISQFAVSADFRNQGIGHQLLQACQQRSAATELTILNIPESELDTIQALEALGFVNEIDQFELELVI